MPYPVPPSFPPLVVNFLQSEDSTHSAPTATSASPPAPYQASARTPSATAPPEVSAIRQAVSNPAAMVSETSASGATSTSGATSAKASQLGAPIEVGLNAANLTWRTVLIPEVERLVQFQPSTPSQPQAPSELTTPTTAPSTDIFTPTAPSNSPPLSSPPADSTPTPDLPPLAPTAPTSPTPTPTSPIPGSVPATPTPGATGATPVSPTGIADVVELDADRQEYDSIRQIFTGEGHAELRFRGGVLNADRIQVNLQNRIAVGEGNARLTRGLQILEGDRFEYNFIQSQGFVLNARGEVFIPTIGSDFGLTQATDGTTATQPDLGIYSPGGLTTIIGNDNSATPGGQVSRLRFEADRIDFTGDGGYATNVRITNDPFSPPELELRANTATFTRLSSTRSEIRANHPRLVLDQSFTVPLLLNRVIIDNRQRDPSLVRFGFDQEDRGGFFVESPLEPIATPTFQLQVRPQIFIQRAFTDSSSIVEPRNFGVVAQLNATLTPTTTLQGNLALTSFDLADLSDNLRLSLRARQRLGRYGLALEYSYRDRLFNGSLGYQNVQSSLGLVVTSPSVMLSPTTTLRYQAGAQAVTARTDGGDLLSRGRFQASAELSRYFVLWTGTALPATATEGLRYTPNVLTPYLFIGTSARGIVGLYTGGESQETLAGSVGLYGQFGHFSRQFLDYTAFNISIYEAIRGGESPFLFDRDADQSVLSLGFTQQIYGPFRVGLQTAINLDDSRTIDTTYTLEYSRRTFAITLRFSPVREVGSLGLRINDFNWGTEREPFSGVGGTVSGGVRQSSD